MKLGAIATIVMTVIGLSAIVFVFVKNSSPYVTVAQARESSSPSVHLAGDIDKSSLTVTAAAATFLITDEKGETTTVVFDGPPPANMGDATKVVAIGRMEGDHFAAKKLLLKCPSKYESEEGPSK